MKLITPFVIAIYALGICFIILYIPYLDISYRYDIHPADKVIMLWHGQSVIFHSLLQTSQYVFPRFWWVNYVVVAGLAVFGLYALCRSYVWRWLKRTISSFGKAMANARHRAFLATMLTGILIISLMLEETALRIAGTYTSAFEAMGQGYKTAYITHARGWLNISEPNSISNTKTSEFTFTHKINSQGYSDKEWLPQKHTKVRIACIGDSFTQGIGATADSSYPVLLQNMLPDCEVMNFGIAGSDPIFGYTALKEKALPYHPDIVTLTVNTSDISDIIVCGGFERFKKDGTTSCNSSPWYEPLYEHFYITRLVLYQQFHIDMTAHLTPCVLAAEEKKALAEMEDALDRFHSLCTDNNTRCVFIFHPGYSEVKRDSMSAYPVMEYAIAKGYETVNMLDEFKQFGMNPTNVDAYFWPLDGHNRGQGYFLFARALQQHFSPAFSNISSNAFIAH